MTTDELLAEMEKHLEDLKDEEERTKDAIRALQGRKKPGRPSHLATAA